MTMKTKKTFYTRNMKDTRDVQGIEQTRTLAVELKTGDGMKKHRDVQYIAPQSAVM